MRLECIVPLFFLKYWTIKPWENKSARVLCFSMGCLHSKIESWGFYLNRCSSAAETSSPFLGIHWIRTVDMNSDHQTWTPINDSRHEHLSETVTIRHEEITETLANTLAVPAIWPLPSSVRHPESVHRSHSLLYRKHIVESDGRRYQIEHIHIIHHERMDSTP